MRDGKKREVQELLTPGQFLQKAILAPEGLTRDRLANAMGVSRLTIHELCNGRRSITIEMSLKLEAATRIPAEMWLNLQRNIDMREARDRMCRSGTLDMILPVTTKQHLHFVDTNILHFRPK